MLIFYYFLQKCIERVSLLSVLRDQSLAETFVWQDDRGVARKKPIRLPTIDAEPKSVAAQSARRIGPFWQFNEFPAFRGQPRTRRRSAAHKESQRSSSRVTRKNEFGAPPSAPNLGNWRCCSVSKWESRRASARDAHCNCCCSNHAHATWLCVSHRAITLCVIIFPFFLSLTHTHALGNCSSSSLIVLLISPRSDDRNSQKYMITPSSRGRELCCTKKTLSAIIKWQKLPINDFGTILANCLKIYRCFGNIFHQKTDSNSHVDTMKKKWLWKYPTSHGGF